MKMTGASSTPQLARKPVTLSMSEAAIFLGVGWTEIKGILRRHRIARHGIPVERLRRILELRRQREMRRRGQ